MLLEHMGTGGARAKNGHPRIGIMGLGVVGSAVRGYFEAQGHRPRLYDPYLALGSRQEINKARVIFVCVPTPYREHGGFDPSAVEEAIALLKPEKIVVIKSTVLPGTTDALQRRHPDQRVLFNPEFLREATAYEDFFRPDRQIVGCTDLSWPVAGEVMALLPKAPFMRVVAAAEAEMSKYVTNAFLAVKVSFANEIYDLCTALGINHEAVRPLVAADARIGPSHLDVFYDGYRGYGGKCLPKDIRSLMDLARAAGVSLRLLRAAHDSNEALLSTVRSRKKEEKLDEARGNHERPGSASPHPGSGRRLVA
jgi:UDPglucose 6-dehydrogenase